MKKRILTLFLTAAMAVSLAACAFVSTRPAGNGISAKEKTFTLTVAVSDLVRVKTITSDKETLGEALLEQGIIQGEDGPYGLYVTTVDGVTADDSAEQWWCLTKGGQSVNTGVDSTPLADGDGFEFTLKEGY